jgi:hypothetical protein
MLDPDFPTDRLTTKQDFDNVNLMEIFQVRFDCSDLENPIGESRDDALRVTPEGRLTRHALSV